MKRPGSITAVACIVLAYGPAAFAQTQTQPPAAQGDFVDYVTRAGDTCPAIAERVYGTASRIDVIHTYNTMGAMPHRFPAGQHIRLPRVPPPPRPSADAEVGAVRNQVRAYTPGEHPARIREPINRGQRVGTLQESSASVVLGNERSVHLEENTLVVVLGRYNFQTQQRETAQDTRLESGSLTTSLAALAGRPPPQPIVVDTPAATVSASPGETSITVDEHRNTQVAAYTGQAEVHAHGHTVVVPEGQASETQMGHPPSPPRPLPPRPEWTASPASLVFQGATAVSVSGEYRVGARAASVARWRVQLARDARFTDVVTDQRVEANVTRFEARELPDGEYFLRVRSVDSARVQSRASEVQRFRVATPALDRGAPGRLASVRVPDGLYCGLDGAALAEVHGPVNLAPLRAHALRCGTTADASAPVQFDVAAADSGPVVALARLGDASWDGDEGSRVVAVHVSDAVGGTLADATVAATLEGEGRLGALRPADEPGTYVAPLRWSGRNASLKIHVTVNGAEAALVDVPMPEAPTSNPASTATASNATPVRPAGAADGTTPAAPAATRVPVPGRFDAGLGLGLIIGATPLGIGYTGALSGRYRHHLSALDVLVGLSVGYERFSCVAGPPTPDMYCNTLSTDPQAARLELDALSVGIPLGAARRVANHWLPYLTVEPQLLIARTRISPPVGTAGPSIAPAFGLRAVVGLQAEFGVHAPYIELGYRYAQVGDYLPGGLPAGGFTASLGYRVAF